MKKTLTIVGALLASVTLIAVGSVATVFPTSSSRGAMNFFWNSVLDEESEQALGDVDSFLYAHRQEVLELPKSIIEKAFPFSFSTKVPKGVTIYLEPIQGSESFLAVVSPFWSKSISAKDLGEDLLNAQALLLQLNDALAVDEELNITEIIPEVRLPRGIIFNPVSQTYFLSHVYFDAECVQLRVEELEITEEPFGIAHKRTAFSSHPCLPDVWGTHQHGAAMSVTPLGDVLVGIGDFGFGLSSVTGSGPSERFNDGRTPLDAPNEYGVVVKIPLNGEKEVYSRGHRNPQGMAWDPRLNQLWVSEHGPQGGGELNLVKSGSDYGWPDVSFGRPYGDSPHPFESVDLGSRYGGRHEGFEKPVLTWLPAIAPSALVVYSGNEFPLWEGDLVLGTLVDKSLRRLRVVEGRVIFDEKIYLDERVRDLKIDPQGRLLVSTDNGKIMRLSLETLPG
jgi:hypothetical protein